MASEIRIGDETTGLLLKESPVQDTTSLPALVYDSSTGEVKYRTITSNTVWGDITGTLSNQTDLSTVLSAKETSLGNPSTNGYILSSTTTGTRYWINPDTVGFTNPMTTIGDLIIGGTSGAASRLGIGTNGYVLTSNGTTASWAASGVTWPLTSLSRTTSSIILSDVTSYDTTGLLDITVNASSTSSGIHVRAQNLNPGILVEASYNSGSGITINNSSSATPLKIDNSFALTTSGSMISLSRTQYGSNNATANFISIIDNPTTSGTVSGKILTATIGTTERIKLDPRVVDGSSAVAYLFDTNSTLSTLGSKLIDFRNNGVSKSYIDYNGSFVNDNVTTLDGIRLRSRTGSTSSPVSITMDSGASSYGGLVISNNSTHPAIRTDFTGTSSQIVLNNGSSDVFSVSYTGEIRSDAIGTTPSNTTTPVAWLKINSGGNEYKLPLYQ